MYSNNFHIRLQLSVLIVMSRELGVNLEKLMEGKLI